MGEIRPLTAIRGVAAMWVLGFHIPACLFSTPHIGLAVYRYGYTAVDLFFILSGFILVTAHPLLTFQTSRDFFWKRIFRIYPLHVSIMCGLAVGLILCSFAHLNVRGDGHYDWVGFPLSLLLLKPYFPSIPGEWNSATWSVGIELACYCTLPAVLPRLRRFKTAWLWLVILLVSVTMTAWFASTSDPLNEGLGALTRGFLGFYLGCCLGIVIPRSSVQFEQRAGAAAILATACIVVACTLSVPSVIPVCSAILIAALSLNTGLVASTLSIRPLVWLGQISFSIYLIHQPVFSFLNKLLPIDRVPLPTLIASTLKDTLVVGFILILSHFSYRMIEAPARLLPKQWGLLTARPLVNTASIVDNSVQAVSD